MPSLARVVLVGAFAANLYAVEPPTEEPDPKLTQVWQPVPVIAAEPGKPPSDAIVLFDGKSLDAWQGIEGGPARWKIENGAMVVAPNTKDIVTRESFGDVQLHLEFRTPAEVKGEGQGRGNSGVFLMGLYELQVLDSHQNETYANGQVGAIYKQHIPMVNPSRRPGEWQTFDVVWYAPRFGADGKLLQPARMTVFHNGVLLHHNAELTGGTVNRGQARYTPHASKLPLRLQDHKNPVAFRNIWVRPLPPPADAR